MDEVGRERFSWSAAALWAIGGWVVALAGTQSEIGAAALMLSVGAAFLVWLGWNLGLRRESRWALIASACWILLTSSLHAPPCQGSEIVLCNDASTAWIGWF